MLNIRYILLIVALSSIGNTWSDETSNHKPATYKDKKSERHEITTILDTSSLEKTIRDAIKVASEKPDKNTQEKLESDSKLVEYTRELAIYTKRLADETESLAKITFLLFIVAAIQAWLFVRQLKFMKKAVNDGTIAANAAKQSADAAVTSINDLERPWLFVEGVRVTRREGAPIQPNLENNWFVSFNWKNVGRAPAIIKSCIFKIEDRDNLADRPDYSNASCLNCTQTISSGGDFETNKVGPGDARTKNGVAIRYVIYGKLNYKDLSGKEHNTGFAVEVSAHLPASSTYENEYYEYYD